MSGGREESGFWAEGAPLLSVGWDGKSGSWQRAEREGRPTGKVQVLNAPY